MGTRTGHMHWPSTWSGKVVWRNPEHRRHPSGSSSGGGCAPRAAVAAVLTRVSGVQVSSSGVRAAALGPNVEVVASSGDPFGGGICGIFHGHNISLNPAIPWLSWKFFNLLGGFPLYKCPSCIISQMHF